VASWGIFSAGNYAGTDQGVDFRGSGQIPALGPATVTDVGSAHIVEGGSYPYVVYRLNAGPYKGQYVYTAENFSPSVHKGQQVKQGQSIGRAQGKYPYIEIGFNKTPTGWNAVAPLGGATAAGAAMKKYIYGLIGTAPPVTVPDVGASFTGVGSGSGGVTGAVVGATKGAAAAAEGTAHFLGEITSASFWIRALEIIGGGLILMLGLYLLAKQVGLGDVQPPATPGLSDETLASLQDAPGISTHRPAYRRSTEGVRRDTVRHDVSEAGERRAAIKRRRAAAKPPSDDIPF
jgi:hypothetical protein